MSSIRSALLLSGALFAGCASLLPKGSVEASAGFESYEAAQRSFENIVPYKTKVDELGPLGFDPTASRNVKLIPYPDLIGRLAPNAAVALVDLDPGIRDCIFARSACQAYEISIANETRVRRGGFWADFMNFERTTYVAGWRFDALLVVRDGVVLFRNFGGEPNNDRVEQQHNPLGPLQGIGESIAGRAVK